MTRWVRTTVDMLEHDILNVGPYDRRSAWLWLITHAAWKDKRVNHKGRPLALKRGQVLAGRAFLAETWGWSEQNVRTFVHLLVAEGMVILNQSGGHFANVLTICNYEKYQSVEVESQPDDQPEPNQSLTSVQPEPNQTLTKNTIDTNTYSELAREGAKKSEPEIDHLELSRQLHDACGPALANEAVAPGLLNLSVPYAWLRHGADLKTMIVPALRARSARCQPGSIRSWQYFATAVADAKAQAEAGLPAPSPIATPRPAATSYRSADVERARALRAKLNAPKSVEVYNA